MLDRVFVEETNVFYQLLNRTFFKKKTITVFVIPSKFFISIVFNSSWAIVNPKRNRKQCALFWWGQLVVLTLLAKIFEF